MTSGSVTKVVLEEEESMKRPEYPKPDTSQMLPFKPKIVLGKYTPVLDRLDILNQIPVKCYLSNQKFY